jgi:hypothetical protein
VNDYGSSQGYSIHVIISREPGNVQCAFIPLYDDDLASLSVKTREAVIAYFKYPRGMTKQQRDLVFLMKVKDTVLLAKNVRRAGSILAVASFLQKYKLQHEC